MNRENWLFKALRQRLDASRGRSHPDDSRPGIYRNETQNDQWIVEHVFPRKRSGYFVEAGAANGIDASSCYVLEQLGWTGLCIEPNDAFFAALVRNRPGSICENVCLARRPGKVVYVEGSPGSVNPYLGGIKANLETVKHGGSDVVRQGRHVEKEAIDLAQLLARHAAPATIDYAAFDIEGSELDALQGFPFDRYTFLALSLECDGTIWAPISELLAPHGYWEVSNRFNRDQPWERYWLHETNPAAQGMG